VNGIKNREFVLFVQVKKTKNAELVRSLLWVKLLTEEARKDSKKLLQVHILYFFANIKYSQGSNSLVKFGFMFEYDVKFTHSTGPVIERIQSFVFIKNFPVY
jgi:hypothetical protein